MKIGEDLRMSLRSIQKRPVESLLLIIGIALGIGASAAGIAIVARTAADAEEILTSTEYREIIVSRNEDRADMELPASRQVDNRDIVLTSADLKAADETEIIEYAYIADGLEVRLGGFNFAAGGRAGMSATMSGRTAGNASGESGGGRPQPQETESGNSETSNNEQAQSGTRRFQMPEIPETDSPDPAIDSFYGMMVSPEYFDAWELSASKGSLFTLADMKSGEPVMILGSELAKILYEDGIVMDRELLVMISLYTIIGVLEPTGTNLDNMGFAPAVMPELQAESRMIRMGQFNTNLHFTVKDPSDLTSAKAQLTSWFDQNYGEDLVSISIPREEAEAARDRNTRLVTVILFLALSGLLIASVNVSNILLSRAMRKQKTIGILKALGASIHDIFNLIFIEALLIGIGGAILGVGISILLSGLMETTMGSGAISALVLTLGIAGAWCVTMILTLLPAMQASKISAADAIRAE